MLIWGEVYDTCLKLLNVVQNYVLINYPKKSTKDKWMILLTIIIRELKQLSLGRLLVIRNIDNTETKNLQHWKNNEYCK